MCYCKIVRSGDYELVVAPDNFPGLKYRGKYCYEHTLVYWQNTGVIPAKGQCVHHKNERKRDNRFSNLELKTQVAHMREHSSTGKAYVEFRCPFCGVHFDRERRRTHLTVTARTATFCSRRCAGYGPRGDVENVVREFTR